jgi:sugar phosphate isomerase/epimerase
MPDSSFDGARAPDVALSYRAGAGGETMATEPGIALQMYTLREQAERDFVGTLRAVAEIGYPAVQLQGYGGMTPRQLRAQLDGLGLAVAGTHLGLADVETRLDEEIAFNVELGNRDLVCAWVPAERHGSADAWHRLAELFQAAGERCRAAGTRLSYHNHAFEFDDVGGQTGLEILFAETDPGRLFFEPDVYWIALGGADPATVIRRYAERCRLIHLKDVGRDEARSFAEVGEGRLDFGPIFAAAEEAGAEWYVVEQDRCARPALESVRLSLQHLREWGKLRP